MPDRPDPSTASWRPELFEGVPGFPEAVDWHVRPEPPVEIVYAGVYEDGGTGFMVVRDATGRKWPFCFDRSFGRLFTGAHPDDGQAALVRPGSPLEADVLALMGDTVRRIIRDGARHRPPEIPELRVLPSLYEGALVHAQARRRRPGWASIQT
ncbi:hypothetical protein SAMN04489712_10761 [Thermomonospora echinospora]|uniref:Uncharacterized protein n=1 Tax=Thermomonospora echinospora TaxID=1992 RepID=A0A1H6BEX4_9ACTN|nr:hypothetical protein [Thermomonospora echinospora]SEG59319.1 hypothetical protein SAMN04489712_10761 [Thermomonospora echinospora]